MRRAKSREGLTGDAGEPGAPPLAEQLTAERARADALASELAALKTRLQVRAAAAARRIAGAMRCTCRARRGGARVRALRACDDGCFSRSGAQVAENSALVKCGYLFKYRPWAEGVFKDPWVKRFFRRAPPAAAAARKRADRACGSRPAASWATRC